MKTRHIVKKIEILMFAAILLGCAACSNDWLTPEALSFYTPENAFVNAEGMYGALTACERLTRHEFFNDPTPVITEYTFSDVCINGSTDSTVPTIDNNMLITPYSGFNEIAFHIKWFWDQGFAGVKYANTVIDRIDDATYKDVDERNAVLSSGYFHRAYRYYRLTNQFGDVPYVGHEVTAPKVDFYSTKREVILQSVKKDMAFAAQNAAINPDKGRVSRGACGHLLTKINLSLALFDDAIVSATDVIKGGQHALMTSRFGVDASKTDKNLIWDLHQPANKSIPANKECLLNVISRETNIEGSDRITSMRQCLPFWSAGGGNAIKTPNGKIGMSQANNIQYEYVVTYGRGIGRARGAPYSTKMIWKLDNTDLRHYNRSWYDHEGVFHQGNWMEMEDMLYNNPALNNPASSDYDPAWYGKPLQLYDNNGVILTMDTIRNWYGWPHYKIYVPDPTAAQWQGGRTDWYIYRLAETYLLRAEAYFWKGELQKAADDINVVRRRAQAREITASEVNMRMILDERARELFYEEPRKTELTRIAFIYAQTGIAADDGTVYRLDNFSDKNFWFDHIMATTYFYNKGVITLHGDEYTMSPYHVLWPVTQSTIDANVNGVINQNKGYTGYENNVPPLTEIK